MKKKSSIFIAITLFVVLLAVVFKVSDRYNDVKHLTPTELQAKNK